MNRALFVPGAPVPQGSKVRTGPGMREQAGHRLTVWRDAIAWRVKAAGWHHEPLTGPVRLRLRFVMPRPKYQEGIDSPPYWHAQTPDADKLTRSVGDALTNAGAYQDDAQIAQLDVVKHWGSQPGVHITLEALDLHQHGAWT